jgi:hypothetical protein
MSMTATIDTPATLTSYLSVQTLSLRSDGWLCDAIQTAVYAQDDSVLATNKLRVNQYSASATIPNAVSQIFVPLKFPVQAAQNLYQCMNIAAGFPTYFDLVLYLL